MSSTKRGATRISKDFYQTPGWCVRALIRHIESSVSPYRDQAILEPCCGDGAIIRELSKAWPAARILGIEIDEKRAQDARELCVHLPSVRIKQGDFLEYVGGHHELVVTNPPFDKRIVMRIVRHAISCGTTIAMLMPLNWCFGGIDRNTFRREYPFDVLVLGRRPSFARHVTCRDQMAPHTCDWDDWIEIGKPWPHTCPACGSKTKSCTSDSTEYGWAIWGPGRGGRWFQAVLDGEEE
jgi:hypothetical protein